jgi:hypothetical protein
MKFVLVVESLSSHYPQWHNKVLLWTSYTDLKEGLVSRPFPVWLRSTILEFSGVKRSFFFTFIIRKVKWRRILNTRFSGVEAFTLKRRWETSKYYHYHYHVYVIQSCSLWKTPVVLQFVLLLFHHLLLPGWGTWMDGGQDGWRDGWMERTTTTGQTKDIIYKDKTRRRFRV